MPVISMFYGIIVLMYYFDNKRHHFLIFTFNIVMRTLWSLSPMATCLRSIKPAKLKLVQAWIEIHQDELMADWKLAINGQQVFKIDPLK